jgi:hypothetical protein
MAYRVADNAFNRENYRHLIGKVFENPPGYAAVEPYIIDVVGMLNGGKFPTEMPNESLRSPHPSR